MHLYNIILPEKTEISCNKYSTITDAEYENVKHLSYEEITTNIVDREYHNKKYGFDISNDEICNYETHKYVWDRFANQKYEWCVIMENNIKINISLTDIIETIKSLPSDWDVFFPYNIIDDNNKNNFMIYYSYSSGTCWGNSIYLLSKNGVKKLLTKHLIRQRLENELLLKSSIGELETYADKVDWFDVSQIEKYEWLERRKIIWRKMLHIAQWDNDRLAKARSMLSIISNIAFEIGVDILLCYGSLLGHVRHGGIMPWDDDIDIGIDKRYINLFLKKISTIEGLNHCERRLNNLFYKIWSNTGENIPGFNYTFPFIDLWPYEIINGDIVFDEGDIFVNSASADCEVIIFEGSKYKIPFNKMNVLDSMYIDWRKKIRVYPYSHRLEKPSFLPFILSIETDSEGRMIDL